MGGKKQQNGARGTAQVLPSKRLITFFKELASSGYLGHDNEEIRLAGLNVVDRPHIQEFVPEISMHLFEKLEASGIQYDAITSAPRGGNAWAEGLIASAKSFGRDIPFYRLNKVSTGKFSIMDGQPVSKGSRLVLVDDTIFRGDTSMAAARVLEDAGFKVVGLVFPVEIGNSGTRRWTDRGLPVVSAYNNAFVQSLGRD